MTSVNFTRRDLSTLVSIPDLKLVVQRFSFAAIGGPKEAVITAFSSESELWQLMNFIRYGVTIVDDNGDDAWWGYVSSIELRVGWVRVGISIDEMSNEITVAYTSFGTRFTEPGDPYCQDFQSKFEYGTKELFLTIGDATVEEAQSYAWTELQARKYPISELNFEAQGEGGFSATIFCRGWWDTLDWIYYKNKSGLVEYVDIGKGIQRVAATISASTIAFSATSTITDYGTCNLGGFQKNDWIYIQNAGSNDGLYLVDDQNSDDEIDINPNYGDGALVTAASGSGSIIVTTASLVYQRLGQYSGSNWNAHAIHARLRSIGSPDDYVVLRVLSDTSASGGLGSSGSVDAVIVSGSISATCITEDMKWVEVKLSASMTFNHNTPYWVSIHRTGGVTASGYYEIDVNENKTLYNMYYVFEVRPSACIPRMSRTPDAQMPFRIVGYRETTQQIVNALEAAGNTSIPPRFMPYIDIETNSGIMTNQYRNGETTVKTEVEKLLKAGTTNRRRLLAKVTKDRTVKVYEEPTSGSNNYRIKSDRRLYTISESQIPLSRCPVGVWLSLADVIPDTYKANRVIQPTEMFVEESEYYPESDVYIPRAKTSRNPWGIGQIEEG